MAIRPILELIAGKKSRRLMMTGGDPVTIGTAPGNSLVFRDPTLSPRHCSLAIEGRKLVLRDAGSGAGVLVNGERFSIAELVHGDVVAAGRVRIRVHLEQVRKADTGAAASGTAASEGGNGSATVTGAGQAGGSRGAASPASDGADPFAGGLGARGDQQREAPSGDDWLNVGTPADAPTSHAAPPAPTVTPPPDPPPDPPQPSPPASYEPAPSPTVHTPAPYPPAPAAETPHQQPPEWTPPGTPTASPPQQQPPHAPQPPQPPFHQQPSQTADPPQTAQPASPSDPQPHVQSGAIDIYDPGPRPADDELSTMRRGADLARHTGAPPTPPPPPAANPPAAYQPVDETDPDQVQAVIREAIDQGAVLNRLLSTLPNPTGLDDASFHMLNARGQLMPPPSVANARHAVTEKKDGVLFLRALLAVCLRLRATDLHIEAKQPKYDIRVRVDGMMVPLIQLHAVTGERLHRLVKVVSDIDMTKPHAVQEGHFMLDCTGRRVHFRVSFTPAMFGQKLVIRILDVAHTPQKIRELGMSEWMEKEIKKTIQQDSGMILMCGPTGCGKTTTLYTLLRAIDRSTRNVITIEDPIEYEIDGATQLPVSEVFGQTFSVLLKSVLRQDPDVLLLGEIRDDETARIAMQAAMTGHLVMSTVHARNGIGALFRLLDLGVEPYLVGTALNLILSQRLARLLCSACKQPRQPTPTEVRTFDKANKKVDTLYDPNGCDVCLKTGYAGRKAIYEMIPVNDNLRDIILGSPKIHDLRQAISANLYTSLQSAGLTLAAAGLTSLDEVERIVSD